MNKLKLFLKSILIIIVYFILNVTLYTILFKHIYSNNFILSNISKVFVDLLLLFIFIITFKKTIVPDLYDFKKNYKKYIKENIKYYLIGLVLMIITNLIIGTILQSLPTNEEANRSLLFNNPISSLISLIIVAPIIEELITRRTFREVFNNEYIYMGICALVFGSLHLVASTSMLELLYIIPYGLLGATFAKIYYNTNNIWSNIFFHSLHNLLAILLILGG